MNRFALNCSRTFHQTENLSDEFNLLSCISTYPGAYTTCGFAVAFGRFVGAAHLALAMWFQLSHRETQGGQICKQIAMCTHNVCTVIAIKSTHTQHIRYSRKCVYLCVCGSILQYASTTMCICVGIHSLVCFKWKVPVGIFTTTCLKIKMVVSPPSAPVGKEQKCFSDLLLF